MSIQIGAQVAVQKSAAGGERYYQAQVIEVRAPRAASPKRCSHDEDRRPGDHTCPRCACARAGTIGGRQDQSALSVVRAYVRCQLQAFVAEHCARADRPISPTPLATHSHELQRRLVLTMGCACIAAGGMNGSSRAG
jgi:hypothetical protein